MPKINVQELDGIKAEPTPVANPPKSSSRRAFMSQIGGASAATIALGVAGIGSVASAAAATQGGAQDLTQTGTGNRARALRCLNIRVNAAQADFNLPFPNQVANGDENRYSNRIGSFSKGLVHNSIGEVD